MLAIHYQVESILNTINYTCNYKSGYILIFRDILLFTTMFYNIPKDCTMSHFFFYKNADFHLHVALEKIENKKCPIRNKNYP